MRHLVLQGAPLVGQGADPLAHFGGRRFQHCRHVGQPRLLPPQVVQRRLPGQRLEPPHAGRRGAFAQCDESPDVPGAPHMGAAAQLQRIGPQIGALARPFQRAHRHHTHLVAIFLAEQRLRPDAAGIVGRHDPCLDRAVLPDEVIHLGFDLLQFGRRHRLRMAEVEPQPVRRVERTALRHMIAQGAAQRLVQKVGRRVVGADLATAAMRHLQLGRLTLGDGTFGDLGDMNEHPRRFLDIGDLCRAGLGADKACIPNLPAAFGIKGRLVDDDLHGCPGFGRPDRHPVADQRQQLTFGGFGVIAQKLGRAIGLGQFEPDSGILGLAGADPGRARLLALLVHRGLEPRHIDGLALFAQRILRQIQREAVGVIELERRRAGQFSPLRQPRQLVIQQLQPAVQRGAEPGFLQPQRLFNQALGAGQFRIGPAHLPHQRRHQLVHHRIVGAQHVGMAHRTAHDPAQDIATPLIGRHHPIGNQERGRAQMVRDHPVVNLAGAIRVSTGRMSARLDQAAHQVGVVVVMLALQQRADPFQPHPGVDALHLQWHQTAVRELLVLHEDVVPDLDEAVAVLIGAAGRAAPDMVAMVIEDLGARPARARRPHPPEVVVAGDADDPVFRQPRHLFPDAGGLIVSVIDGDAQLVLVDGEVLRQQFPGEGNGLLLEIVAKAEVAQHLEKRVVPRGVTHIVEVIVLAARPHAFLRRRRPLVIPRLDPGETVLELHHARVGKHQRRVIARHQRRAFHHLVPVAGEKIEEGRADVVQTWHCGGVLPRHGWAFQLPV